MRDIMRDPDRIPEVLAALRFYWQNNPDLRLGQIVCNMARQNPFYEEDDRLLQSLEIENVKQTFKWSKKNES